MTAVNSKVLEFCQFMGRLKVMNYFFVCKNMPAFAFRFYFCIVASSENWLGDKGHP
jgi:hypothetical protein